MQNEWISTQDSLPPLDQWVLVAILKDGSTRPYTALACRRLRLSSDKWWWNVSGANNTPKHQVVYYLEYAPLPTP